MVSWKYAEQLKIFPYPILSTFMHPNHQKLMKNYKDGMFQN